MGKEVTVRAPAQVIRPQEWMGDQAQLAIVRRDLAPGLNDQEFQVFLGVCRASGLNPILRQVHAIRRNDKHAPAGYRITYQVGIDGLRLIADRSGVYAGSDEPEFSYASSGAKFPATATCTVWKVVGGARCPFTATARWAEYYPGEGPEGFMWRAKPHVLLGKCAEALALRKAFPAETSALYAPEEMHRAEAIDVEAQPIQMPRRQSQAGMAPAPAQDELTAEVAEMDRREKEAAEREAAGVASQQDAAAEASAGQHGQDAWVDAEGNWIAGVITFLNEKSGTGKRGAWKKVGTKVNGHWVNAFDTKVQEAFRQAKESGRRVKIRVERDDYGLKAMEVRFS